MNRERFPGVVAADRDGRVLADNAASTQIPRTALAALTTYLERDNAQKGAAFERCARTDAVVDAARASFAELLGVAPADVGFGANATSIAFDFARLLASAIRPGDRILVTAADHYANVLPWTWLRAFGAEVDVLGVDPHGDLDRAAFAALLANEPLLVALPWASNVTGTVFDVAGFSAAAADAGALVVVDGVQAAPHRSLVLPEYVDFAFFSAYKVFAPHVGAWYARPETRERFFRCDDPYLPSAPVNWSMETGTQSHEALAGWLGTVEYLRELGAGSLRAALERIAAAERGFTRDALERFAERADRIELYGRAEADERLPVFAFNVRGEEPERVARELDADRVEARVGDFYAPRLLQRLARTRSAVRLSFVHYNEPADLDRCFAVLDRVALAAR